MRIVFSFCLSCAIVCACAQSQDIAVLTSTLLGETPLEEDLQELCDEIGGRETGSDENMAAVEWGLRKFREAGLKSWKQPFTMPALWLEKSTTARVSGDFSFAPLVVSKFHSPVGTHVGRLVDAGFGTKEDFARLGTSARGSFALVETELCFDISGLFSEYVNAATTEDLARAAGVRGIIFMASRPNRLLYRFVTKEGMWNALPQIVMSREDAQRCLRTLREGDQLNIEITIDARTGDAYESANVLAEITGTEHPEEVLVIGAHIDSWALGTGANDNGCNVALMIDIARQMQKLGIKPKRTIRFALWNGEEQGFFGSHAYTQQYADALDSHLLAVSIDIGSGGIIGFFTNGRDELIPVVDALLEPMEALGPFTNVNVPVVGTDNFDFMLEGVPNLVGNHNSANYGPNYHAASDTYDKVDLKSLKLNSAIVAALILGYANLPGNQIPQHRQSKAEIQEVFDHHKIEFQMRMFGLWDSWIQGERGRRD
jgi:hypothetical protein